MGSLYKGHEMMIPITVINQETADGVLSDSSAAILTAPATGKYVIHSIVLHNTHTGALATTISTKPSGGTERKCLVKSIGVNESEILEFAGGLTIKNGGALHGLAATASKVNYLINYSTEL